MKYSKKPVVINVWEKVDLARRLDDADHKLATELWVLGNDTKDIASILGYDESVVYNHMIRGAADKWLTK